METADFQFLGYRVSQLSFHVGDNFSTSGLETIDPEINTIVNYNDNDKRFAEVVLTIILSTESKNFDFNIQIKGGFKANENMSDDLFEKMTFQNAPAILFPFARAIISSYTAQANIPTITLPLFNLTSNKKN